MTARIAAAGTQATLGFAGISRLQAYGVKDYGAKGDYQFVLDGSMPSGSNVLTSLSGKFVPSDVGKTIWLAPTDRGITLRVVNDGIISSTVNPNQLSSASAGFTNADIGLWVSVAGAGIAGTPLVAQIVTVSSSSVVTLSANAQTTVASRSVADASAPLGVQVTSATAAFTAADVGRTVTLVGAGMIGALYTGMIMQVTNGTTIQLNATILTAVAGATLTVLGAATNLYSLATSSSLPSRVSSADASASGTTFIVNSATAAFTATDVGRFVLIPGAGSGATTQVNQIIKINSPTQALLNIAITVSVTNQIITILGVRSVSDAAITHNTVALTSSTGAFRPIDIGAFVTIVGGGLGGADLLAQIVAYTSPSAVTISTPAGTDVTGGGITNLIVAPPGPLAGVIANYISATQVTLSVTSSVACVQAKVGWATDDTVAINNALAALVAGGEVFFQPQTYCVSLSGTNSIYGIVPYALQLLKNDVRLRGHGARIMMMGGQVRNFTTLLIGDNTNPYTNIEIDGITFDGNAAALYNPIDTTNNANNVIPSQIGLAPLWGSNDFGGVVNVRGPYTPYTAFPKIGQKYTTNIIVRNCRFYRASNAGLVSCSYAEEIHVEHCVFDGEGIWACVCHLDGLRYGSVRRCHLKNMIPLVATQQAIAVSYNGDTGIRPIYRSVFVDNVIENICGNGIGGTFWECEIRGNSICGCTNTGIALSFYNGNNSFTGSFHNTISGNRLVNNRLSNITLAGAVGTTRSGTVTLTNGSATLTSWSGSSLLPTDVGAYIVITGGGAPGSGRPLIAVITQVLSVTSCLLSVINQSGATQTGLAATIGGQAGLACNYNLIKDNIMYNDQVFKGFYDYSALTYLFHAWSGPSIHIDIALGAAAPVGGNFFDGNHIEGNSSNAIRDNSIGCPSQLGEGAWNLWTANNLSTEAISNARVSVGNANTYISYFDRDGLVTGNQGGNAGNVQGTGIKGRVSVSAQSWTPGTIAAGGNAQTTVPMTGSVASDQVIASYGATLPIGVLLSAQVTTPGTVTLTLFNATSSPQAVTVTTALRVDWWQQR